MFSEHLPLAAIVPLPNSVRIISVLSATLDLTLYAGEGVNCPNSQIYQGSLGDHLKNIWTQYRGFVFVLSCGAVVRLIAPLLEHKSIDPAVVVIDLTGQYVISLLGGHQGGGDQLARMIAIALGAQAILTGASNNMALPAIDTLGKAWGWVKGEGHWNQVSSAIARGEKIEVLQEAGSTLWQKNLPLGHPFIFNQTIQSSIAKARIYISPVLERFSDESAIPVVQWYPRVLWLGIGCSRNTSRELIQKSIEQTLERQHLSSAAIAALVSIDLKADEAGLVEVAKSLNIPFLTYSAEVLSQVEVPNPSAIVESEVGTASVAEAAAILAGGDLLVTKAIFQDESGWVTLAISQSQREYIGRTGSLSLIGTGPGSLEHITTAAKLALTKVDVIIGYQLYLDLIEPLQRPGQIIEAYQITQEQQRADRAIELARWGLNVAVISSGDAGIYGMAGLVLETLQQQQWDGHNPQLEVIPGITALQSASARLGAPLMHDFCAISLSDLLTPSNVIEMRLEAAAKSDFVIALYNPRSQTRQHQLIRAWEILSHFRSPDTPVGMVKSAYREQEEIILSTLAQLLELPIDMLTTVIIGNQSTARYLDYLITPRGYLQRQG